MAKLSGYYEVIGVEHTEDCDHGDCILVEIKNEDEEYKEEFDKVCLALNTLINTPMEG